MSNIKNAKVTTHEEKAEAAQERFNRLESYMESAHPKIKEVYRPLPDSMKRLFLEVHFGKKSLAKAIKLRCLDCSAWQREEVKQCTSYQCALWKLRPYQEKGELK